jgi:hypothetical protein
MLSKECKAHLEEVGENGLEHAVKALKIAGTLQLLVPALVIHAFAPRFFTDTASRTMQKILDERHSK